MNVLEPKQVSIGDRVYRVTPFPGIAGWRLLLTLTRKLAGPVARAAGAVDIAELDNVKNMFELMRKMNFEQLARALESLFADLPEEEAWGLTQRLLANVDARNDSGDWVPVLKLFDLVFIGDYSPVLKLVGQVLEVNYRLPLPEFLAYEPGEGEGPG